MTSGLKSTGKKKAELDAVFHAWADQQPTVTGCLMCDWQFAGTAADCRVEAVKHRAEHHPEHKPSRRRRGHLQRWTNVQDDYREEGLANAREVAAMLARREDAA